jgi:hypothetical protein
MPKINALGSQYRPFENARWRGHRQSQCIRRLHALPPGTGSGGVFLACKIVPTNERAEHLEMP